jgi:hypothetical protein
MRQRLNLTDKIVPHNGGDAYQANGGARTLADANYHRVECFAWEQAEPRLAQMLDRRPISRMDAGMIRQNLQAFAKYPPVAWNDDAAS